MTGSEYHAIVNSCSTNIAKNEWNEWQLMLVSSLLLISELSDVLSHVQGLNGQPGKGSRIFEVKIIWNKLTWQSWVTLNEVNILLQQANAFKKDIRNHHNYHDFTL